jgi:hypothetical protein
MAHVLGLQDNPLMLVSKNTGWSVSSALSSLQSRYKDLNPTSGSNLNFGLVSAQSSSNIGKTISRMSHGEYVGFASNWWRLDFSGLINGRSLASGHAYSLHAVKEGEKTHFIYVNRGQRHYDKSGVQEDKKSDSVMVFSVDNTDAEGFAREMMDAAKSFDSRTNISKFLHQHQDKINPELSKLLGKKNQKTGNCTIANSNIAWHFQLASEAMRQSARDGSDHQKSFADAYAETKSTYQKMRVKDRVEAFKYLLNDKNSYLSDAAYSYNCMQALEKFAVKDQIKNANHIQSLASSADDKTLKNLTNLLFSGDFDKKIEQYVDERIKKMQKDYPNIPDEFIKQYRAITTNNLSRAKDKVSDALKKAPEEMSLLREQKTSTNKLLLHSAGEKERVINDKLRSLYSYAEVKDKDHVDKAFEELCLACCKRRFYLTGESYSADTKSAHWLIDRLSADDETGKNLRARLDIKDIGDIKAKVEDIVARKNTVICPSENYKERYRDQLSAVKLDKDKSTSKDELPEETVLMRNPGS